MQSGERERAGSSQQGVESNNQESSDWRIESWPGRKAEDCPGA